MRALALGLALIAGLCQADPSSLGFSLGFIAGEPKACYGSVLAAGADRPLESVMVAAGGCWLGDKASEYYGYRGWSKTDAALFRSLSVLALTDVLQTRSALQDGAVEQNPLLGGHPDTGTLLVLKGIMLYVVGEVADGVPENRTLFLSLANVIQLSAVVHNYNEGAVISFGGSF